MGCQTTKTSLSLLIISEKKFNSYRLESQLSNSLHTISEASFSVSIFFVSSKVAQIICPVTVFSNNCLTVLRSGIKKYNFNFLLSSIIIKLNLRSKRFNEVPPGWLSLDAWEWFKLWFVRDDRIFFFNSSYTLLNRFLNTVSWHWNIPLRSSSSKLFIKYSELTPIAENYD